MSKEDDLIHAVDMSPAEAFAMLAKLCNEVIEPATDAEELKEGMDKISDSDVWTHMLASNIVIEWAESLRDFMSSVASSRGYKHDGYFIGFGDKGKEIEN